MAEFHADNLYDVASSIQQQRLEGNLHSYDIVEAFVEELVTNQTETLDSLLPKLNILVTEMNARAVSVHKATSVKELRGLLVQTTHIPFITGRLQSPAWDGGFSRVLHPTCESTVSMPLGPLSSYFYTLYPGLDQSTARDLWGAGRKDAAKKIR